MERKQILLLAWEYPPTLVGGLGRHVYELSKSIAHIGHVVHVITNFVEGSLTYECMNQVHVHRVQGNFEDRTQFYNWIMGLNEAMVQYAQSLCSTISFDVIHAHDWLVCSAAISLQEKKQIPLIITIHATEHGRNNGIHTPLQKQIHMKEKELVQAADAIIVCSNFMKQEVQSILQGNPEKMYIFPNGIDAYFFGECHPSCVIRKRYFLENRLLVFSIGRMVSEKGFYTIIEAAPALVEKYPLLMFVIAGKGPMLETYQSIVKERGLGANVSFLGHITEEEQRAFLQESDVVLVPSLYEPFGIVALEGMLAEKPTVVSDVGGLGEIIIHGYNGRKITPGSAASLIEQLQIIFEDKEHAKQIAFHGHQYVLKYYSWKKIADLTIQVYEQVVEITKSGGGMQ
ncbi:glycosyltransferase family 4 protein [Ectobacillus sp. sgz5001026]|uniref:glycosyltransferase family 4 protein n=1 Tax=Ectobacillus sp. sgz5001026 TaxID=3242473 RepID=UPI0036D26D56